MKNFKVWQQHPPLRVKEEAGRKYPTHSKLSFEQDVYLANLKPIGHVREENAHKALVKAKKMFPFAGFPMVEETAM